MSSRYDAYGFSEAFLVYATMMGDVRIKTSLERVTGSLDCGVQKNLEAAFAMYPEEYMALKRGHRRERGLFSGVESSDFIH
ncbi:hypothetical protein Zmor_008679 [Zophobas morio]|uniref:Uncharacterized protein n=1 Tax=Zophobas morio TaxID=2755281 RepID=A0AA38HIN7_9CUCU|nr:hypothetical protein Zmor_008679 [Zophobas morio]